MTTAPRRARLATPPPSRPRTAEDRKPLFGFETEYAFVSEVDSEHEVRRLLNQAGRQLKYLRGGRGGDLYLENGARLYLDVGNHPEYCTPECSDPADLVRHLRAGDRIMAELVQAVSAETGTGGGLFKYNCDYSGAGTTWGSHESYLHRCAPEDLPRNLIPHLLTRIIYTGAGGFVPGTSGIRFTLSPRVWHLDRLTSPSSTHQRGLFHLKDEPLADGEYHRLHLLCGESLCSELGNWLRVGTTALVTAMVDEGLDPGRSLTFKAPLESMRTFALDPTCQERAPMEDGRELRAVDIQRHYLEQAERELGEGYLPPWAGEVCRQWRSVLDRLETDRSSLSRTLDWSIKQALYRRHAEAAGFAWENIPGGVETIRLRRELFEIDMKFGQLGPEGIFNRLEAAGVLEHGAPGVEEIDDARVWPPVGGRAELRGRYIRELAGRNEMICQWQGIWDHVNGRFLDLTYPFQTTASWVNQTPQERMRAMMEGVM